MAAAIPAGASDLKKDSVGFFGTIGMSLGIQAPTAGIALIPATMAGYVGGAGPLAFLLGVVVGLFIAGTFSLFARRFNSAGSIYTFNGIAIGPAFGFVSAMLLLLTYVCYTGSIAAQVSDYFAALWSPLAVVPWPIYVLVLLAIVGYLSFRSIDMSAITAAAVESIGISFVIIIALFVLFKGANLGHGVTLTGFTPNGLPLSGLAFGIVFAFTGFSGFEAAAVLGEESRDPRRAIPRAILSALLVAGVAYIFGDWIENIAFPNSTALAHNATPLLWVTQHYVAGWLAPVVDLVALASAFGGVIGSANGSMRLMFTLGRDGVVPSQFGRTHPRFGTPTVALVATLVLGFFTVIFLAGGSPSNAFGYVVTMGATALLVAYLFTMVAGAWYFFRHSSRWYQVAIPTIGIPMAGYVLYSSVLPVPTFPYNVVVYAVGVWLVLSIAWVAVSPQLRRRLAAAREFRVEGISPAPSVGDVGA